MRWPRWPGRGPVTDPRRAAGRGRWVVVDVESSGLDATRDRLIAIGALAVTDGAIDLSDAFEVVLRQSAPSPDRNIEVHGIGAQEQAGGEEPAAALRAFLAFAAEDPLVAWHAPFDARLLERSVREHLDERFAASWIDLAVLVPLAWPQRVREPAALDAWIAAFGVPIAQRHRAIADCLATAQVFLAFLPEAARLGLPTAGALAKVSAGGRWLRGGGFP